MTSYPLVSIGIPIYNGERHIREALDSLLAQTFTDFEIIISDNASTDTTFEICKEYGARDKRITVYRNKCNLGMVQNFRIVVEKARGKYFMWASDHDLWHPEWLRTHVEVLDEYPEVVLAYPLTVRISDTGENLHVPSLVFDTFGLEVKDRIRAVCSEGIGFGNMVYGLFRADALCKAGIFRNFLLPDVLLLTELALYGSYKQVQEELWFRRYIGLFDIERQKKNTFAKLPWYAHFPWPLVNSRSLAWNTVLSPHAGGIFKRCLGLRLTVGHLIRYLPLIKRDSPWLGKYTGKLAEIVWLRKMYRTLLRHNDA